MRAIIQPFHRGIADSIFLLFLCGLFGLSVRNWKGVVVTGDVQAVQDAAQKSQQDEKLLAALIFGESANQPFEVMHRVGSTVLNRMRQRPREFGGSIKDVIYHKNAYYAAQDGNKPFQQAMSLDFKDSLSREKYDVARVIARGLLSGALPALEGQFFFKDNEAKALRSKLRKVSAEGPYSFYSY